MKGIENGQQAKTAFAINFKSFFNSAPVLSCPVLNCLRIQVTQLGVSMFLGCALSQGPSHIQAQIEKEEKQAKDKIQSELEATKANIQKKEKQAVEEARRVERDEKKAAREMEKQALQAKTDKDRLAAEEASETAFNAATEKAEKAILEAQSISEEELTKALEKAEDARTAAAEKAELLEKAAVEKFETALSQAAETAERAEKDAVFEEEAVEQAVVETVDAIEKEDLLEENQLLEKAKVALSAGWTFAAPLVIPGIFIALYAVLASFSAPPPEPCLGAESEETRKMMGRQERPKTSKANMDPWNDEKKRMAAVGSGAMAVAAVLMSSGPVSGFVSPSSAKLTSRSVQRMAEGAKAQTTPEQSSKPSTFGRATLAQGAVAAVAVAAVRRRSVGCLAKKASKVIRLATKAKSSKITGADPLHVIISGAGVGGLLLAKALSKEPTIKVTLLEQAGEGWRGLDPRVNVKRCFIAVLQACTCEGQDGYKILRLSDFSELLGQLFPAIWWAHSTGFECLVHNS